MSDEGSALDLIRWLLEGTKLCIDCGKRQIFTTVSGVQFDYCHGCLTERMQKAFSLGLGGED